ncbi:MAG TPA: GspH/FimT family protein [bacterium]|nr:GspH/FimT family protein [bacterium]
MVSRGASLAEVLVAVGVLAVLSLIAVPQLMVPAQVPAGQAARGVAADLALARQLAIAGRTSYVVTFSPGAGPFTSYTVTPQGGTSAPDFPKVFPVGLTVIGTPQITFDPSGAASSDATVILTAGSATAQVRVVGATGYVQETGP